jgi:hypothetical protein
LETSTVVKTVEISRKNALGWITDHDDDVSKL